MSDLQKYDNLYQLLKQRANTAPQSLALIFAGKHYSYQQFYQRVRQTIAQLNDWELHKGDRILLAWGNHLAFCEMFFASLGLGIEVIPFSIKLKQTEGESLASKIKPKAVFYDSNTQNWLANTDSARCISLEAWERLPGKNAELAKEAKVTTDDVAVIMFTSGTTGEPKGAIITHGNLINAVTTYAQEFRLTDKDSTILAVPIYHITGLSALLVLFVYIGGSIYIQQRFHPAEIIDTLKKENISFLHGSPTVFVLLCQEIKKRNMEKCNNDFSCLNTIACGAGNLNEGLIKQLKNLFPHTSIRPVYGLTETSSPATIFPGDVWGSDKTGSSGLPVSGLRVVIRGDEQQPLPSEQIGHIWLQGNMVIKDYWQQTGKHPACDLNGWFYTGDLGYLDEDGYLFVKDRSKDMINRGGEKIYSIDLENIISNYPGVKEVAIVPVTSQIYGEEPVAFIVAEEQSYLSSDEILFWLKGRVAKYKLPVHIIFVESLPRTHNGKISKRQLKDQLAGYVAYFSQEESV